MAWLASQLPEAIVGASAADAIIASVAEKRDALRPHRRPRGRHGIHIAARVAARHDLPFAIIRVISDGADHALPPAALVGMRPDGGIGARRGARLAARQPDAAAGADHAPGVDAGRAFAALAPRFTTCLAALGIGLP